MGGVRLHGVRKRLGSNDVLRGGGFELEPGTVAAVVGANGSGKTTLLRILAGVVRPDAGGVEVCGRPPGRGLAGHVPPGDRGLYWRLTGRQNLEFFARIGGCPARAARRRAAVLGAAVDAERLLPRRVGECSTGERRRLALAKGFVAGTPVVLLDEPYEDLDEEGCRRLEELARQWAAQRGVVVYAAALPEGGPEPDVRIAIEDGRVSALEA